MPMGKAEVVGCTSGSAKSWGKDGVNKAYSFLLSEVMDRHCGPPRCAIGRQERKPTREMESLEKVKLMLKWVT